MTEQKCPFRLRDLQAVRRVYMSDGFRPSFIPDGCDAYLGWTPEDVEVFGRRVPENGRLVEEWSNGFRSVYVFEEERAILTYCEGSVDLTQDRSRDGFYRRFAGAHRFYTGRDLERSEIGRILGAA